MFKRLSAIILIIFLLCCSSAFADKTVTANGVGKETKELSFEIVDTGLNYWPSSSSTVCLAYVAVKNTDSKYIYLNDANFDFEDDSGHLIESAYMVSRAPNVIAPNEVGYFYVCGINGGYLDENVNTKNGVNLVAQFSLQESHEAVDSFEVTDTSMSFEDMFNSKYPVIKGRIKNNTDEDYESMNYIVATLKDADDKILWIEGTNIDGLYSSATVGCSIDMMFLPENFGIDCIKNYEIIAKPHYYQYK